MARQGHGHFGAAVVHSWNKLRTGIPISGNNEKREIFRAVIENLQLLCWHCNSVKGDRPQKYLVPRLRELGTAA